MTCPSLSCLLQHRSCRSHINSSPHNIVRVDTRQALTTPESQKYLLHTNKTKQHTTQANRGLHASGEKLYLIVAFRQGRLNERHLRAFSLGHEAPIAIDNQPQPVHLKAAVSQRDLRHLLPGTRLHRVDVERGYRGLALGWRQTSTSNGEAGHNYGAGTV